MTWIAKVILLLAGTITAGMIPAIGIMWANYNFDPTVCWTNVYGGWIIVPMIFICTVWAGLVLNYLERLLGVCNHGK